MQHFIDCLMCNRIFARFYTLLHNFKIFKVKKICKFCLYAKHADAHMLEFWQILTGASNVCVAKISNVQCACVRLENLSQLTVCQFPVGNSN